MPTVVATREYGTPKSPRDLHAPLVGMKVGAAILENYWQHTHTHSPNHSLLGLHLRELFT